MAKGATHAVSANDRLRVARVIGVAREREVYGAVSWESLADYRAMVFVADAHPERHAADLATEEPPPHPAVVADAARRAEVAASVARIGRLNAEHMPSSEEVCRRCHAKGTILSVRSQDRGRDETENVHSRCTACGHVTRK